MVQRRLAEVTSQSGMSVGGSGSRPGRLELPSADGFTVTLSDGRTYKQEPQERGWARAQRLPTVRTTLAQLEFIYEAYTIGKASGSFPKVKLSAAEAHDIMKEVGKPGATVGKRFAGHSYFDVNLGRPRFARSEVVDESKIKGYFGKTAEALKKASSSRTLERVVRSTTTTTVATTKATVRKVGAGGAGDRRGGEAVGSQRQMHWPALAPSSLLTASMWSRRPTAAHGSISTSLS